mgnify:CR=1 FL=1
MTEHGTSGRNGGNLLRSTLKKARRKRRYKRLIRFLISLRSNDYFCPSGLGDINKVIIGYRCRIYEKKIDIIVTLGVHGRICTA